MLEVRSTGLFILVVKTTSFSVSAAATIAMPFLRCPFVVSLYTSPLVRNNT